MIKYFAYMEELLENQCDQTCEIILGMFACAHNKETGGQLTVAGLEKRRVVLLGKLERFRDQGEAMNQIALNLIAAKKTQEAFEWLQRMRNLGAAHGFFLLESAACLGAVLNPKPKAQNPEPESPAKSLRF